MVYSVRDLSDSMWRKMCLVIWDAIKEWMTWMLEEWCPHCRGIQTWCMTFQIQFGLYREIDQIISHTVCKYSSIVSLQDIPKDINEDIWVSITRLFLERLLCRSLPIMHQIVDWDAKHTCVVVGSEKIRSNVYVCFSLAPSMKATLTSRSPWNASWIPLKFSSLSCFSFSLTGRNLDQNEIIKAMRSNNRSSKTLDQLPANHSYSTRGHRFSPLREGEKTLFKLNSRRHLEENGFVCE